MRSFIGFRSRVEELKSGKGKIPALIIYPDFNTTGRDIMKKGGKFYAVLDKETGMWSTDEGKALEFIDREIMNYIKKNYTLSEDGNYYDGLMRVVPKLIENSSTGVLKEYNSWINNIPPNHNYHQLDTELTEKDTEGNYIWRTTSEPIGILFNNGTTQTSDFEFKDGGVYNSSGRIVTLNDYTAAFKTDGMDEVWAYVWNGEERALGDWPGTKMEGSSGEFSIMIHAEEAPEFIIFHNNAGEQTPDWEFEGFCLCLRMDWRWLFSQEACRRMARHSTDSH